MIPWEEWDKDDEESVYCLPVDADKPTDSDDESVMSLPHLQVRCNYDEDDSSDDELENCPDEPSIAPSMVPSLVRIMVGCFHGCRWGGFQQRSGL